ncbi:MAG: hypothetical protein B7Y90_12320 [Alphaproteobacteria bacterium 32-64-14]|nr:MAG: hypothetical protein B7Y90_12320 [Alphaproteobacteria bacterium 32-64-14]
MHDEALALRRAVGGRLDAEAKPDAFNDLAITIIRGGMTWERKVDLIAGAEFPGPIVVFLERHAASPLAVLVASIALQHAAGVVSDSTWRELLMRLRPAAGGTE